MGKPPEQPASRLGRLGTNLFFIGAVMCALALIAGFVFAAALNMFGDPEDPAAIYGKLFAGTFVLLGVSVVLVVAGLVLVLIQGKPDRPALPPRPEPPADDSDPPTTNDNPEPNTDPPAIPTKSWDEAYSKPGRRRY